MEIHIGRKVTGKFDVIVPDNYKKVSRNHARIVFKDNKIFLTDLDSSNGTYVNGRRVASREITNSDTVLLGDKEGNAAYKINLNKINNDFDKINQESKTDFIKEFQSVKNTYINYNEEKNKIKSKYQFKSQLPRIIASVGVGILFIIISKLLDVPNEYRMLISPIIMAVGFIPMGKKKDPSEGLVDIDIKYQDKYVCPKCKKPYNLNMHWKKLESGKTCPHKCGAIFSK